MVSVLPMLIRERIGAWCVWYMESDVVPNLGAHCRFHADHGYQLGEHNEWEKFTNFELGTRVPLIIRVPWKPAVRGRKTTVMAELVDMCHDFDIILKIIYNASIGPAFRPSLPTDAVRAVLRRNVYRH